MDMVNGNLQQHGKTNNWVTDSLSDRPLGQTNNEFSSIYLHTYTK